MALDTYDIPNFHDALTKAAAWERADGILAVLIQNPGTRGRALAALEVAKESYQDGRDLYGLRRTLPLFATAFMSGV